ncbi:DUF4097 family beta strand repeat-containing protein [Amycolatopsis anabasis]|uniref:DUF4097 family beta strand repeat-containing protein n=1 Tax=Amycolatopsis anabasis TaxID=1840409 RepID=UPI00131D5AA3|nr:DUF4097 family beta strand repeat-containing protein [Amycolatopsis anabasis]
MPTEEQTSSGEELVRTQAYPVDGPIELDISVTIGRIDIRLSADVEEATVEVRHDPSAQEPWATGVTNVLNWVTERFGDSFGADLSGTPVDAVQQARIEKTGNRLSVRAPKALPLRRIPLAITVHAPAGSHLEVKAGAADVKVTGPAGRADLVTGTGEVALDRADGAAIVRTGSGAIRLGPTLAGLQVRTGSGDVEASSLSGSATIVTGTGAIWLGVVSGEVLARSGSGDLSVAEAAAGKLELLTGSGEVRIGIRSGVVAEITLSSGSGKVSSELDVSTEPPDAGAALKVNARTGYGHAVVTRAAQ